VLWEGVSAPLAGAVALVALVAYWSYRVGSAAYEVPANRRHAARRELLRIGREVGEALLGWALIVLAILGIVGIIVTWPPNWGLVLAVCGLAIAGVVALAASIYGVGRIAQRLRERTWRKIADEFEVIETAWQAELLSIQPTDRAAVERIVAAVYVRTRRAGAPAVQWASSPPEFSRLLAGAAGSRRLHPPPPWWISFRWYAGPWWAVWDEDYETVRNEVAAAAAAGVGIGVGEVEELVSQTSWFSFRRDGAIALEHPIEIHVSSNLELHNVDGPAVRFADGWAAYAIEGVVVPAQAIEDPDGFDPLVALTHENLEVRRVLLQHLGWDRLVRRAGLAPQAEDDYGRLWQVPAPDVDPLLLLEVENATPERDGSHRRYFVRVPPDMRTPREATAWTFGMSEHEYAPDAES